MKSTSLTEGRDGRPENNVKPAFPVRLQPNGSWPHAAGAGGGRAQIISTLISHLRRSAAEREREMPPAARGAVAIFHQPPAPCAHAVTSAASLQQDWLADDVEYGNSDQVHVAYTLQCSVMFF